VIKVINIAIGIVIVALVIVTGGLVYSYIRPGSDVSSKLDYDLEKWQAEVNAAPDDPLARANLGVTYMDKGDTEAGIRELKAAVDLAPSGYTYMTQLGLAYVKAGDATSALEMFKRAIELYPKGEKYSVSFQIANVYWEQGDLAAAKDYIQQSLADNNGIWNAHYLLGQILEKEGDPVKARQEYQEAAKYNPTDAELQQALQRVST
jgi:Tfp pilus assembly protein PilF